MRILPRLLPVNRGGRIRMFVLVLLLALLTYFYGGRSALSLSHWPVVLNYFRYTPQEGDVVFQSLPHADMIDAIEGITQSPYSHCGVVLRNDKGQWVVIESVFNVHETPLFLWMLRGRGADIAAYRLDAAHAALIPQFKKTLLTYLGYPYDYDYNMANDQAVYCSDLVYLAFAKTSGEKMGTLEKLGDLNWKPYESFIKSDQYGHLPLDRVMITPASLARAPQLHQVFRTSF